MRKLITGLLGALALLASGGPAFAAESEIFGLLKSICFAHPFDLPAAETEARRVGFGTSDTPLKIPLGLQDVSALERTVDGRRQFVVLGRGVTQASGVYPEAETVGCVVGVAESDPAAIEASQAWLGAMKPALQSDGITLFTFRDGPAGRTVLGMDDKAGIGAAIASTEYRIFAMTSQQGITMIIIAWVRPPMQAL